MSTTKFTHLSVHSDNSLMMGYGLIDEYIQLAKEHNQEALALTDLYSMVGIYKFMKKCKKQGIKPLPGITLYLKPVESGQSIHEEKPVFYGQQKDASVLLKNVASRITLLAKNKEGLVNLFKLLKSSYAQDNFHIFPRVSLEELAQYASNLICLSGDRFGEISCRLRANQYEQAKEYASILKSIFQDDFYIELIPIQGEPEGLLEDLVKLALELKIKPVITNDVYYPYKENALIQENLIAMGNKNKMSETPVDKGGLRFRYTDSERYLKDSESILRYIKEQIIPKFKGANGLTEKPFKSALAQGIKHTQEIADKIEWIEMEYNNQLRPPVDLPKEFNNSYDYIKHLIQKGFKRKRAYQSPEVQAESKKRIEKELEVIYANDFVDYFLTVADFIHWTREQGQSVGVGRGCFLPGNIVTLRENSKKPIEKVEVGRFTKTHDITLHKIEKLWEYDVVNEDCVEIELSNGQYIRATADHKIFKKDIGFVPIEQIEVGDILLGPKHSREAIEKECIYCNKKINMEVKGMTFALYREQPYKKLGDYCCNDCKNKRLILKPEVKAGLSKGSLRNKDEDVRKRNSESVKMHWKNNPGKKSEYMQRFIKSEAGVEYRKRLSEAQLKRYSQLNELEKLSQMGKPKYKSGYFKSEQMNNTMYYASSYELKFLNILETDSKVEYFDRYKGVVKYKDLVGTERSYLPDFYVRYKDGAECVVEVKAKWQTLEDRTINKLMQAKEYFEKNNKIFKIVTEVELEALNDLRHNEIVVLSKRRFKYTGKVYDLQVEGVHNYIVGGVTVHNSVAGSEVAYLLDISRTDPIRHDLMFERFISPGRGATYEIEYEDGSIEQVNIANSRKVNGEKKYIYQLNIGDEVESD